VDPESVYRELYRIRRFEETVLEKFSEGVFSGTTHTYIGQEANAVGVIYSLREDDIIFSNHRCHGHFLAYGGEPRALFAELMGKETGVCGGRGGSQHLQYRNFYSNGIQGGITPVATGMALAEKFKASSVVSAVFLGDGTLGQGVLYESLNMAALWQVPILFILENNHIAQTTPSDLSLAGEIKARFAAFGIPAQEIETCDVTEILSLAGQSIAEIRDANRPQAIILHTHRFGPHSKGDDTRSVEVISELRQNHDPLSYQARHLDPDQRLAIQSSVDNEIAAAYLQAFNDLYPDIESI
jgi:TPP-dependent pyruvate/acetoin dehydrogenase alpha subunit